MVRGEPGDATFDLHTTDPPHHTLVGVAFTPGRIAAMRPRIQEIADLIEDYPFSLKVIAELLAFRCSAGSRTCRCDPVGEFGR